MIQDMNKNERLAHAVMLMNSYKRLMTYDIADGNKFGEEYWKRLFKMAFHIVKNMYAMRGISIQSNVLLC